MNDISAMIVSRIRGEIVDLDRAVRRVGAAWRTGLTAGQLQDFYLDSVALNLHSFYSGTERLFELIVRHLDGAQPSGANWHRELLQFVTSEAPDARPAVISEAVGARLDEYRRFRHLVRNVYTTNLAPDRIAPLVAGLPDLWRALSAELRPLPISWSKPRLERTRSSARQELFADMSYLRRASHPMGPNAPDSASCAQ